MIKLDNVTISFDSKVVLENFSYEFEENKITLLKANSGIGKTTILNLLANLIKPTSGVVLCDKNLAYCFQEDRLIPYLSINENLSFVLNSYDEKALELIGLEGEENTKVCNLSGGMKQRVALLRCVLFAIENNCELVLLDEPFKGLDIDNHLLMIKLIKDKLEGKTIIIASHDELDEKELPCNKLYL